MIAKRTLLWILTLVAAGVAVAALAVRYYTWQPKLTTLKGAVIRRSSDTYRQDPVPEAVVTISHGAVKSTTHSDASGYFQITFPQVVWPGETLTVTITHPDYHALSFQWHLDLKGPAPRLIIAELKPITTPPVALSGKAAIVVSDVLIRYTVTTPTEESIGSAVRTFQVVNKGNVPCDGQGPCSPNGVWKEAASSITLDAGLGNEYRDVRASCIAGPCPFTRIVTRAHGRTMVATAEDWSDTATFLLEAEVFHTSVDATVRESYPVLFDHSMSFTLPPTEEGVTIEAEINGASIYFPIGPDVYLRWATCTERTNPGDQKSIVYQCALKPGYAF